MVFIILQIRTEIYRSTSVDLCNKFNGFEMSNENDNKNNMYN